MALQGAVFNVVFQRRAEIDPPVVISETYRASQTYDHGTIRIGDVSIEFHEDRARFIRLIEHLRDECDEKLATLKNPPDFKNLFGPGAGALPVTVPALAVRKANVGAKRKKVD